ncbi:MAG: 2-isopropylmalate synthase [Candidatus Eisenbacteria bacterium]|uniref:2-isopropylmalate synthase n=1 Tax=Eiseniibacteriota bacterium TaxID=2212470 RepID=A0A538TD02_UNCEI|nr:MAG: 2-isopropylmalate synthase [Candidatus Eisenbacteria bacterium]
MQAPSIEDKVRVLHLMERLGIDTADIGLPGAGPHVVRDVTRLAQEIAQARLKIQANCAARTLEQDILPVVEISQKTGIPIEVCTFIGSSPIRQYAEDWTLDTMLRHTEKAVALAVSHGLPVMYVTEDTVRAQPETLRKLFQTAIRAGAKRLCLCDTVGHATPTGAMNLVRFARQVVTECGADVGLDWHGHCDRGLAVINTIAAIQAGASRVHGCAIGIGERVGNTPIDQLLVNLRLLNWIENDLTALPEYCELVSRTTGVPIPPNYPVVGRDAFRTGTGVHAAAVIKAFRKGQDWLADRVYSGVPASLVGRRQQIEVGPMSGESNVVFWLQSHGIEATPERVRAVFQRAKSVDRMALCDRRAPSVSHVAGPVHARSRARLDADRLAIGGPRGRTASLHAPRRAATRQAAVEAGGNARREPAREGHGSALARGRRGLYPGGSGVA